MSTAVETDGTIQQSLQRLSNVYKTIVGNHILNEELVRSPLPGQQWHEIEGLFYSLTANDESKPLDFFYVYQGITALRRMASMLLTHVRQRLSARISIARRQGTGRSNDIALLELTAANLDANVKSLVDRLVDFYVAVNKLDASQNGTTNMFSKRFPELSQVDSWMLETLSDNKMV